MLQRKVTLCGFIRSVTLLIAKKPPDPFKVFFTVYWTVNC